MSSNWRAFGFKPGSKRRKRLVGALKKLGVDYVFDTTWAADITVMEEASEFQERLERYYKGDDTVTFNLTSCCPAWVKFIEQNYPGMLCYHDQQNHQMQIFSTIAKNIGLKSLDIREYM